MYKKIWKNKHSHSFLGSELAIVLQFCRGTLDTVADNIETY